MDSFLQINLYFFDNAFVLNDYYLVSVGNTIQHGLILQGEAVVL